VRWPDSGFVLDFQGFAGISWGLGWDRALWWALWVRPEDAGARGGLAGAGGGGGGGGPGR
jgi:hypothetical protein